MRRIARFIDLLDAAAALGVILLAVAAAGYAWQLGVAVIGAALLVVALATARAEAAAEAAKPDTSAPPARE